MSQMGLSNDERRCLQMWFRQALAQLEQQRVISTLLRRQELDKEITHRLPVSRRRTRRVAQTMHNCEAVAN